MKTIKIFLVILVIFVLLIKFKQLDLMLILALLFLITEEITILLKSMYTKIRVFNPKFRLDKYLIILTALFSSYFILSHIFLCLPNMLQNYLFISIVILGAVHTMTDDIKSGLLRFMFQLIICLVVAFLSLIPSYLISLILHSNILNSPLFSVYITFLSFVFYIFIHIIKKQRLLINIVIFLINSQYTFFTEKFNNFKTVFPFIILLLISTMFRSLLIAQCFPSFYYSLDDVLNLIKSQLNFIKNGGFFYSVIIELFRSPFACENFHVHCVVEVNIVKKQSPTVVKHLLNSDRLRRYFSVKLEFKGSGLKFKPFVTAALTGQASVLIDTINTVSIENLFLLNMFTNELRKAGISKQKINRYFSDKVKNNFLLNQKSIKRPLVLESVEDVYGALLHFQQYYSISSEELERVYNLIYWSQGKDSHKYLVSGFEQWVFFVLFRGSIRTAFYESLLKTRTLNIAYKNNKLGLVYPTTGIGTSKLASFGDLVCYDKGIITYHNFKFYNSVYSPKNQISVIKKETSKLPLMKPNDRMEIVSYIPNCEDSELLNICHKIQDNPDCSVEFLNAKSPSIISNGNITKLKSNDTNCTKDSFDFVEYYKTLQQFIKKYNNNDI